MSFEIRVTESGLTNGQKRVKSVFLLKGNSDGVFGGV